MSFTEAEILANRTLFDTFIGPSLIEEINTILGPTFIMLPLDALAFGVLMSQVSTFYENWREEHWGIIASVVFVACMELVTTGWIWNWMWNVNVSNYGSIYEFLLAKYYWPLLFMTGTVSLLTQLSYGRKAWLLWNKSWIVLGLCTITALFTFASNLGLMYTFIIIDCLFDHRFIALERLFTYLAYFGAIVCDIVITTFIFVKLLQSRTGWTGTNTLIYRLILVSFEAQLPPSLCAFAVAITVIIQGNNTILAAPWLCISGKVYGLCYMFSLNSRSALKNNEGSSRGGGLQSRGGKSLGKSWNPDRSVPGHILVDVERIEVSDGPIYSPTALNTTNRQPNLRVEEEMEMSPYSPRSGEEDDMMKDSKEDLRGTSQASVAMLIDKESQTQKVRKVAW